MGLMSDSVLGRSERSVAPTMTSTAEVGGATPSSAVHVDELLRLTARMAASDIHLKAGSAPVLRIRGELVQQTQYDPLALEDTQRLYEQVTGQRPTDARPSDLHRLAGDLAVPTTSIYSRTDGIVNWRTCLLRPSDTAENIEVHLASHVGLGVNPAALWAVADRLAQLEGEFKQFDRSGPFAIAYAPPENAQS